MRIFPIIACAALALLITSDASAHGLNLFVTIDGGIAKGNAYFTGGDPAKNVPIEIFGSDGQAIGQTRTDAEGNFVYETPRAGGTLSFVASTPDGHRAESKVEGNAADQSDPVTPQSGTGPASNAEVLRAIDHLEHRLWLRDVIGGIGFIFGLAGFWALWKSRQGRAGH